MLVHRLVAGFWESESMQEVKYRLGTCVFSFLSHFISQRINSRIKRWKYTLPPDGRSYNATLQRADDRQDWRIKALYSHL